MLLTTLPNPTISSPNQTSYPYPIQSRLKTHSSILNPLSPHAYGHRITSQGGPGPSTKEAQAERRERHKLALGRAEARALAGKRPTGVDMGKEAEDMSDDDRIMDDEKDHLNHFGDRFLLPYGRRQTQSELDAAPVSPTPSQEQNDRMQEDPHGGTGGIAGGMIAMPNSDDVDIGDGEEGEEVDLDASVEDMDGDDEEDEGVISADE